MGVFAGQFVAFALKGSHGLVLTGFRKQHGDASLDGLGPAQREDGRNDSLVA